MRRASFLLWGVLSVAAFLIFLAHQAGSARAQDAQEHVLQETRQACLCHDYIPDVAKITACMEAKYTQINEECRLAMIRERYVRRALARSGKASSP
jgi:hypothetical protein